MPKNANLSVAAVATISFHFLFVFFFLFCVKWQTLLPHLVGKPNEMPEGSKFKRPAGVAPCCQLDVESWGAEEPTSLASGNGNGTRFWPRGERSIYRHVHSLQVCAATPAGMVTPSWASCPDPDPPVTPLQHTTPSGCPTNQSHPEPDWRADMATNNIKKCQVPSVCVGRQNAALQIVSPLLPFYTL